MILRPEAEQVIIGPRLLGEMEMAVMSYDQGLSCFRSPLFPGWLLDGLVGLRPQVEESAWPQKRCIDLCLGMLQSSLKCKRKQPPAKLNDDQAERLRRQGLISQRQQETPSPCPSTSALSSCSFRGQAKTSVLGDITDLQFFLTSLSSSLCSHHSCGYHWINYECKHLTV